MSDAQAPGLPPQKPGARRRALLILGGIIGALAVVAAGFMLLGGGEEEQERSAARPTRRPQPAATPTAQESAPPETFESFEGRDPFEPLVKPPAGEGGGGDGEGGSDGSGSEGTTSTGRRVALLDIYEDEGTITALVEVDGEEYTVAEGDVFADNFRVDDLGEDCGDFTYGDEGFTLCIGQEVRK